MNVPGRRRVIITVLDESINDNPDTWAEFDKIISEMNELPNFEDFPRLQFERELINFEDE